MHKVNDISFNAALYPARHNGGLSRGSGWHNSHFNAPELSFDFDSALFNYSRDLTSDSGMFDSNSSEASFDDEEQDKPEQSKPAETSPKGDGNSSIQENNSPLENRRKKEENDTETAQDAREGGLTNSRELLTGAFWRNLVPGKDKTGESGNRVLAQQERPEGSHKKNTAALNHTSQTKAKTQATGDPQKTAEPKSGTLPATRNPSRNLNQANPASDTKIIANQNHQENSSPQGKAKGTTSGATYTQSGHSSGSQPTAHETLAKPDHATGTRDAWMNAKASKMQQITAEPQKAWNGKRFAERNTSGISAATESAQLTRTHTLPLASASSAADTGGQQGEPNQHNGKSFRDDKNQSKRDIGSIETKGSDKSGINTPNQAPTNALNHLAQLSESTSATPQASALLPTIMKHMERMERMGRNNLKVNLTLPDGTNLSVRLSIQGQTIRTRIETSSKSLQEEFRSSWKSLQLDAEKAGIQVTLPEFVTPPPGSKKPSQIHPDAVA